MAPTTRILTAVVVAALFALTALGYTQAAPNGLHGISATTGAVNISAPRHGAILPQDKSATLNYEMVPSPNGDRIHIYVEGGADKYASSTGY